MPSRDSWSHNSSGSTPSRELGRLQVLHGVVNTDEDGRAVASGADRNGQHRPGPWVARSVGVESLVLADRDLLRRNPEIVSQSTSDQGQLKSGRGFVPARCPFVARGSHGGWDLQGPDLVQPDSCRMFFRIGELAATSGLLLKRL